MAKSTVKKPAKTAAKKSAAYSLVIVESPAKARTISKFLGSGYIVEASIGHVRDLPRAAGEIPEKYRKEKWARLGVNVDAGFEPLYVVPGDKRTQIKKLSDLLKEAADIYLATDEDREGEAISWHLLETLKPKVPVKRLAFHEITEEAIREALASPRDLDRDLVQAQETRRIIDRLYGYEVSPLLWYKIKPKLSAGRVQSVAVRLIVERERERIAFHNATYWDLLGTFQTKASKTFQAGLISAGSKKIPAGKDFNPATGKLTHPEAFILLDEKQANELATRLKKETATVQSVEEKPYTERPYAPFTTSTLQQEANRKFGFTAKTTMALAQSLYENGYITYMRTDSTNLSGEAVHAARKHIEREYGKEYLPDAPRIYITKVKNAQEAHEAIRPAGSSFKVPDSLRNQLSADQFKLYDMIWKRTVASQMPDCKGRRKQLLACCELKNADKTDLPHADYSPCVFSVSGKTIDFPGYLRAYVEGSDDPEADIADREVSLPDVRPGDVLKVTEMEPKSHTTMPPGRFSEAALTKTLTEKGIGRPSTYAAIIETIQTRGYVFKKGGAFIPTWLAFSVCQLMEEHLPDLINYDFTAQMEDQLDAISRGELEHLKYLKEFYFGDAADSSKSGKQQSSVSPGLKLLLTNKTEQIDAKAVNSFPLEVPADEPPIVVRVGKFGPYVQQNDKTGSIPEDLPPDELTYAKAVELLNQPRRSESSLGSDPATGKPIYLKDGRFGPYLQLGEADDKERKNASLLRGMEPADITLDLALRLLSLPRNLGKHPETGADVFAQNGKYGPYISSGKETRSLPADLSPLDVTLDQAAELLAQPKTRGRKAAKAAEPVWVFGVSPVTGKEVQVLSGRFGDYITDGVTNLTLPKGTSAAELTFEEVLEMLFLKSGKSKKTVRKKATAVRKKTTK
ncbi:MAG: type I DNA topoisomerase [Planctomycetaceae bacterium]|jgi:DNA topoisomerase-1|nr:type I DNA topoisomerase [Planctomycetaceae bacterium]